MSFSILPANKSIKPTPFKVDVPTEAITELKQLLKSSKLPPPTFESSTISPYYGVTGDWMVQTKEYWEREFDWKKNEKDINDSMPQFKVSLGLKCQDGVQREFEIHFAALFSQKKDAVPIILSHGWPGSFLEFKPIFKMLCEKYGSATLPYTLIVPSLPGFGFSSAPPKECDFDLMDVATLFNELMVGLGYGNGYIAQGGDVGSDVSRRIANNFDGCKAVHLNSLPLHPPRKDEYDSSLISGVVQKALPRGQTFFSSGRAYALEHGERTSTIGFVLSSSPIALLAWVGEKFLEWSDVTPALDDILDTISIYWFTNTIAASLYQYREMDKKPRDPKNYIHKPFGFSFFPFEIAPSPEIWAAMTGRVIFYREHDEGGHFAALERPEVLFKDVEEFIEQVWRK